MRLFICFFIIAILSGINLFSAEVKDFDTRGNDFWLTFPPNIHVGGNQDSLYIYIGAEKPTKGTISFGGKQLKAFEIPDIKKIYTYVVSYLDYELFSTYSETPSDRAFHVVTDSQVTVYALSKATKTSDAFLVLPTNVLGMNYYIMSYNSDNTGNDINPRTPSQFAIIASQDRTTVNITLSTNRTSRKNQQSITTILQKGQTYLVQASTSSNDDLTGTHVVSDKPIAVVGSHQRASIPYDRDGARDFLIEQMIPVHTWGYDAFLVPFPEPNTGTGSNSTDIYRILAAHDSTQISINTGNIIVLNAGQIYENRLLRAATISATKPIMVALFKKSTVGSGQYISDPFMMLVPPAEQFLKSYRWINSQAYTISMDWLGKRTTLVYEEQYVIVVAPNTAISSIRLDGKNTASPFTPIPNSTYSYATIAVSDGVHSITANEGIGIYVFGYGSADSYGYIGGMNMVNTTTISSAVSTVNISANSGEVVNLPLILDSIKAKQSIETLGIDHYSATLRFNATLLTPQAESQRGKIENGFQTITVTGSYSGQGNGDTLASIPMVAGLGDAESTPVEILEFHWIGIAGDTIAGNNGVKSAVFTLTDVFHHPKDGMRLVNPQEGSISLSIEPNPSTTLPVSITFGGEILTNATLIVYNTIGRKIADLSSELAAVSRGGASTSQVNFIQPNLPQGVYFVRLASGEYSIVRPLVLE